MPKKYNYTHSSLTREQKILLKNQTAALVSVVGSGRASEICGISKKVLRRTYSTNPENFDRFLSINMLQLLEAQSGTRHLTTTLAELNGKMLGGSATHHPPEYESVAACMLSICNQCPAIISDGFRASTGTSATKDQRIMQLEKIAELEASLIALKKMLTKCDSISS